MRVLVSDDSAKTRYVLVGQKSSSVVEALFDLSMDAYSHKYFVMSKKNKSINQIKPSLTIAYYSSVAWGLYASNRTLAVACVVESSFESRAEHGMSPVIHIFFPSLKCSP